MRRDLVREQDPAEHAVDEQDRRGHCRDRQQGRHRTPDAEQQDAQIGQQAEHADDTQEPQDPQQRRVLAHARDEHGPDDDEVEDIPAVAEERERTGPAGDEPQQELHHEDGEEDLVQQLQLVAEPLLETVVGLETEHDGVRGDHAHDERREAVGVDESRDRARARAAHALNFYPTLRESFGLSV